MHAAPPTVPVSGGATPLLKVGQIAERSGKTVRAIRFYEELGLLEPAERTKGGFRKYDPSALVRIHWIDRLQELGFSLRDIRSFLGTLQGEELGPAAMDHLREFYSQKLVETKQAIARLQGLSNELQESLTYLRGCQNCAPTTPRSACRCCAEHEHQDTETPVLVAAVHG